MLIIKGRGGKINLCFTSDTSLFEAISDIEKEKNFFKDANCSISYEGLNLTYDEEILLAKNVKNICGTNAVFEKKHCLSQEKIEYSLKSDERIVRIIEKNLRSGEIVKSRGDLIVYGDVNPGALLVAQGNITIIGVMRGSAHILGEGKVYATYMNPSQIKIGNVCSYNKNTENVGTAVALAESGEIILQCL